MGTPKQLLSHQGRSLIRCIADVAIASVCDPIVVVLGANAEQIYPELTSLPIKVVENMQWTAGMTTSIRSGIQFLNSLAERIEAVVITLCDQPFISAQLIDQLAEMYRNTHKPIVASEYANTIGVPALFDKALFPELTTLTTTEGAKQVIQRHQHQVGRIPFPKGVLDLDTPEDYQKLQVAIATADW
jgi:molybdenum cofactor cytidylyltransferase